MNIVNKLTLRHLMRNKRRTLVTVIGVIISVAMIMAVATLSSSFLEFAKKNHIANEGEWHVLYKNVSQEQLEAIEKDKHTEKVILSRDLGYANLAESENPSKPYLFFKQYNSEGFKQFPIEVIEGRAPSSENELLISEHMMTNGLVEFEIGDSITVQIGDRITWDEAYADDFLGQTFPLRVMDDEIAETIDEHFEKTYTIVGMMKRPTWEPFIAPGYTVLTYMSDDLVSEIPVNASVVWKKVNKSTSEHAMKLGEDLKIEEFSLNDSLLRYYGLIKSDYLRKSLYGVATIIMAIIIVGSVSLIYNAFAISVSERSRHLGMLSSVGATKKQKRNSVFFEGFIIGMISIPLGILAGIFGIWVTFLFIQPLIQDTMDTSLQLTVVVTPMSVIVAIFVSALTIFISTYIPANRASRISAIDAIRQAEDIKLTSKQVKTSKIVRKVFGVEAEFGLKNLKRNKRRYIATVFSLVISIILFLTVSFFGDQMRLTSGYAFGETNYDIKIHDGEFSDSLIEKIQAIDGITNSSLQSYTHVETKLPEGKLHESFRKHAKNGEVEVMIELNILDERTLHSYAQEVGASYDRLTNQEKLSAIVINQAIAPGEKRGIIEAFDLQIGDQLDLLSYHDWDTYEDKQMDVGLEVMAATDKRPLGVDIPYFSTLHVIISEEVLEALTANYNLEVYGPSLALESSDPIAAHNELERIVSRGMYIENLHKLKQEEDQTILLMSVFTYGFIALITLISVANIFNTISTSISLRTREFGMLKSVGMTPKGFNRMINYESLFYGIQSLIVGLPISLGIMYLIYNQMAGAFEYPFRLPWISILITIVAVFAIVGISMLYASARVKKENIIDALKKDYV